MRTGSPLGGPPLVMELNGKTAIVTGGTRGIGRSIAESLVKAGVNVCLSARSRKEIDEALLQLTALEAGGVTGIVSDVRNYSQVQALCELTVTRFGGLDILVNNAGVGMFQTVEEMSPDDFRTVIETNLLGVYHFCHEAIPLMRKRGGGYIINISSLAGTNAHPKMAAYNASKFGLNGFSEALMQEVRHDGIKVSYIMPGSVNTEFGGDTPTSDQDWQLRPDDVARAVIHLLEHDDRALVSRVEIRPSQPPKK